MPRACAVFAREGREKGPSKSEQRGFERASWSKWKWRKIIQLQCNISRWRNPAQLFGSSGPGRIGKRRKINTPYTPADQWANVTARDIFFHGERPITNCNTVLRLFDCWKLFFVDFPLFFLRFFKTTNPFSIFPAHRKTMNEPTHRYPQSHLAARSVDRRSQLWRRHTSPEHTYPR